MLRKNANRLAMKMKQIYTFDLNIERKQPKCNIDMNLL